MKQIHVPGYSSSYHFVYYVPRTPGDNTVISERILSMKEGKCLKLEEIFVKKSVEGLKLKGHKVDYVVRALGSVETAPLANKALQRVGTAIAEKIGANFIPQVLNKDETSPMHTIRTASERKKNIDEKYKVVDTTYNLDSKCILVIDDVTTSHNTAEEIARAIHLEWPKANLIFIALAQTNYNCDVNKQFLSEK